MTDQTKIPINLVGSKDPGAKELGADKVARNTARFDQDAPTLRKPPWIRVRLPSGNAVADLKSRLRDNRLVTVCEEATCPNIHECLPITVSSTLPPHPHRATALPETLHLTPHHLFPSILITIHKALQPPPLPQSHDPARAFL